MDTKFIKPLIALGIPGVSLGIFYLLYKNLDIQLSQIDSTWSAIIAILFLVLVSSTTIFSLKHFSPEKKVTHKSNSEDAIHEYDKIFSNLYDHTTNESEKNLIDMIEGASERIDIFGLTRNFYVKESSVKNLLIKKSREIPICIYMMDPDCETKKDRYRLEPLEAKYGDPDIYREEVESEYIDLLGKCDKIEAASSKPGLCFYYYNFPCSFGLEIIDNKCRVMFYGMGDKGRGSPHSPILVFNEGTGYFNYFKEQMNFVEDIALGRLDKKWERKAVKEKTIKLQVKKLKIP